MTENDPKKIIKALKKKGFVLDSELSTDHDAYVIRNPETGKYVYTVFSRGSKGKRTLGQDNLHHISDQLKFRNVHELDRFVRCKIGEKEYRDDLSRRGLLNRKN